MAETMYRYGTCPGCYASLHVRLREIELGVQSFHVVVTSCPDKRCWYGEQTMAWETFVRLPAAEQAALMKAAERGSEKVG